MKIKIYGTKTCVACRNLKAFLDDKNQDYEYIDVSVDIKARDYLTKSLNITHVPFSNVGGRIIEGFDKEEWEKLLKKKED